MHPRQLTLFAIGAALALTPRPSRADDRAMAQQLFDQGKQLLEAGKTAEACEKLSGAAQLSPTPGVRLNLSDCYAKLGRVASAWAKADEALSLAERGGDGAAADEARRRRDALKPKLSYLTISVPKESALTGLEVRRDGEAVPAAAWGMPIPVDAGEHEVQASASGRKAWSAKKMVTGEGATTAVTVPALEAEVTVTAVAATAPATPAAEAAPTAETGSSGGGQKVLGLAIGGAGVVAMGVGGVLGLSAKSKYDDARGETGAARADDSASAVSRGNTATLVVGVGAALAVAGVVVWLTAPSSSVSVGTNGSGVVMRGSF